MENLRRLIILPKFEKLELFTATGEKRDFERPLGE
jgi:hypothetical protein